MLFVLYITVNNVIKYLTLYIYEEYCVIYSFVNLDPFNSKYKVLPNHITYITDL